MIKYNLLSFVSWMGTKTAQEIHHELKESCDIFLVNPAQLQDG